MQEEKLKRCRDAGGMMETRTGACRFCGQAMVEEMPMEWAQEDINEYVTEMCSCDSAAYYQRKKKQKERAHERVVFKFGEGNQLEVTPERAESLLHEIVELVGDEEIRSATVEIGNGVKVKIGYTMKERNKITRTKAEKSAYEE